MVYWKEMQSTHAKKKKLANILLGSPPLHQWKDGWSQVGTDPQGHRLLSFRFSLFSHRADFSPHGGKVAATALSTTQFS